MGGTIVTWLENTLKLRDALGPGLQQGERGGRRGRLEADGEEDHLPVRVLDGDAQGVERRVDEPDIGPLGLGLQQVALAARAPASCRRTR